MNSVVERIQYNDGFAEKWIWQLSPPNWRNRVAIEFRDLPIEMLEPAGSQVDADVVNGWVERLQAGLAVPPLVGVLTERGTVYLHDGNHRYYALREYLGEASNNRIRVAVAVPQSGYCFRRRSVADFSTYVLERDPLSARTMSLWLLIPLLCAISVLLTRTVPGVDRSPFFVFLIISVLIAARVAGWLGGILASFLNCVAAAYLVLPPIGSVAIADRTHAVQFALAAFTMIMTGLGVGLSSCPPPWLLRLRRHQ